ncbi:hypothetical protein ACLGIH_20385 [Streptomyces sp. HMX87]|uniref:hypothetical protein n=1 Tax=Streptomyces sp. HMX87 TaxID=3390849 RepID=UPI003A8A9914
MRACTTIPLSVTISGQEMPRLNLLCPLYGKTKSGRKRADFTRTVKLAIRLIDRKEEVCR